MARTRRDEDDLSPPPLANAVFAGEDAAKVLADQGITGPLNAITEAKRLRKLGASREEIHAKTSRMLEGTPYAGVHFGPRDKKPRFEISDDKARFNPEGMRIFSRARVADVLDHPELYKAVPSVGMTEIERSINRDSGYDGRLIQIGKQHITRHPTARQTFNDSAMGPTLHEVSHDVQAKTRLNPGASPDDFQPLPQSQREDLYWATDGETEARMAADRQKMTPAQRRANPPKPDVPWDQQVAVDEFRSGSRKQAFIGDLADVAVDAWKRATTREIVEGRPIHQRRIDPRKVSADPEAFQFKSGGDSAGVTERLKGVTQWDPLAAGKQIVYQRANGEYVIADGHQRRGLALRAIEKGQKGVALDAFVLREKDGWTPRDVRAYAALKNMKESSGNALDMAKVMRERPDLVNKSLPMSDTKIREAIALSKLSPKAFDMVVGGAIRPEHAAAVGANVGETSRHADMLTEMAKAGMRSAEHARLYVSQALAAPSISETTGSLFGDETKVRSLLAERAKVLDRALSALKNDKRIFAMLEREAANIEAAGNKLAHASNLEKADMSGRLVELVEKLSTTRGPVSEMLDKAALAMAEGKSPSQASNGFVNDVRRTMKDGGINGLMGNVQPAPAPVDPNQMGMFGDEAPGKPQGWSDEARAASAEARKANAKGDLFRTKKSPAYKYAAQGDEGGQVYFKSKKARDRFVQDGIQTSRENRIGRIQAMIEDGSPKPSKDIDASVAKGQQLKRATGADAFADGWKAAKDGRRLAAGTDPDFAAGYRQYQTDKSPRAAERAMVEYLAGQKVPGTQEVTLAGKTKPGEQGSFLPDATTKEKIAAAAKAKGRPGAAQQPMDDGMFGSGMNQTDLVEMAKKPSRAEAVDKYAPKTNEQIIEDARSKPAPSRERMNQLDRRVDAVAKAELARAARGDEPGYEKAKRIYAKAQDAQLTAVAANAQHRDALTQTENQPQKPAGWSDEARKASADVRAKDANQAAGTSPADQAARYAKRAGMRASSFRAAANRHLGAQNAPQLPSNASLKAIGKHLERHLGADQAHKVMGQIVDGDIPKAPAKTSKPKAPKRVAQATAPKAAAFDPYSVGLVPTAQREGPAGLAKAIGGMTGEQARATAKAQGIHVPATIKSDAGVREFVARATFKQMAERRAAAGGDPAQYRAMAEEAGNHLKGTQNKANREAIAKNRKANAKPDAAAAVVDLARKNDALNEIGKAVDGISAAMASKKQHNAALTQTENQPQPSEWKPEKRPVLKDPRVKAMIKEGVITKQDVKTAQSIGDLDALAKGARASREAGGNTKPPKPSRAGKVAGIALGPVALGAGIAAAAVIAANTSAEAGQSQGQQAKAAGKATLHAAAPVVAVGGGLAAGVKLGLMTAGRAVAIGTGIGAVMVGVSAAAYANEARKEGKGAGGIAKAAVWGAVNGVVPIDAVRDAARSTKARIAGTPARPTEKQMAGYVQANNAFERQQSMNTTQTDHSDRKPGWGPEARIAAAKARGVDLPYGGNPAAAPGYVPPKVN